MQDPSAFNYGTAKSATGSMLAKYHGTQFDFQNEFKQAWQTFEYENNGQVFTKDIT
jgi:hypothetical protein